MSDDRFTEDDHERARLAGEAAMARIAADGGTPAKRAKPIKFLNLGVEVRDGQVYRVGFTVKRLGPLVGAHAEITDPQRRHRVGAAAVTLMPLVAPSKKDKATAFVLLGDGTVAGRKLDGNGPVKRAQSEVVRFNALSTAAS
jgi:hypothetical protein